MPSSDQVTAQIRQILPILGTTATLLGWVEPDKANAIVTNVLALIGPVMILSGIVWSALANTHKAIVQSAANIPDTVVLTRPDIAEDTPNNPNVIAINATPTEVKRAVEDAKAA